jgi:hypothetical protein
VPVLVEKSTGVLVVAELLVDEFPSAYYADRGGAIADLMDKPIGTCTPAPAQDYSCRINKARQAVGKRKLDCKSDLTAADFKEPY